MAEGDLDLPRKLKPVYDAMDAGNNKHALKLIQKSLLDKLKPSQRPAAITLALKTLALYRTGKHSEALVAAQQLIDTKPTDDHALQTLLAMFKVMDPPRLDLNLLAYNNAVEATISPVGWTKNNSPPDELAFGLYFAYCRLADFLKQQQIALKIHASKPQQYKYLNWACLNMHLQFVLSTNRNKMIELLPDLAVRLLTKFWTSEGKTIQIMDGQSALMMVRMLCDKRDWAAAKEILDVHADPENLEWQEWQQTILDGGQFNVNLFAVHKTRLERNVDDWFAWQEFVRIGTTLGRLEEVRAFISACLATFDRVRGPNLAQVLFYTPSSSSNLEQYLNSVKNFFLKFSSKKSLFSDLCSILEQADESRLTHVKKMFLGLKADEFVNKDARALLTLHEILFFLDSSDLDTEAVWKFYFESISSEYFISLKDTEDGPLDDALVLLIEYLVLRSNSEPENVSDLILEALYIASLGISKRKFSQSSKLWAIRLLCHPLIGASNRAYKIFQSLDIKQIQWESLGHLLLDDSLRHGDWDAARTIAGNCFTFHVSYQRDAPDMIILAHRENHLSECIDFSLFRDKMHKSLQLRYSYSTLQLLTTFQNSDPTAKSSDSNFDSKEEVNFKYGSSIDVCQFNNDFKAISTFSSSTSLQAALNIPLIHTSSKSWLDISEIEMKEKFVDHSPKDFSEFHSKHAKSVIKMRDYTALCLKHLRSGNSSSLSLSLAELTDQLGLCKNSASSSFFDSKYWELLMSILLSGQIILDCFQPSTSDVLPPGSESLIESKLSAVESFVSSLSEECARILNGSNLNEWTHLSVRLAGFISIVSYSLTGVLVICLDQHIPSKKNLSKNLKNDVDAQNRVLSLRRFLESICSSLKTRFVSIAENLQVFVNKSPSDLCQGIGVKKPRLSYFLLAEAQSLLFEVHKEIVGSHQIAMAQLQVSFELLAQQLAR